MKKLLIALGIAGLLTGAVAAYFNEKPILSFGATILFPTGGGTGSSTLSGILIGAGTAPVKTLTIGSNLTLTGTTLSASGGGGSSFGNAFNFVQASPNNYLIPTTTTMGLIVSASSTIGSGTQAGGLTISGGATTTGNAYFAGNVGISSTSPSAQLTINQTSTSLLSTALLIDGIANGAGAEMALDRSNNTGTEEANIDFDTAGTEEWQLGMQNNSTNDFELWDGLDDPGFTVKAGTNFIGFGTTTPFGDFAINADYGDVLPGNLILNVASSSLTATTSLFSVSNIGSTTIGNFGACSGLFALNTTAAGTIICGAANGTGGGGGIFPFTQTTYGITNANATGTLIGFNAGLYTLASSTIGDGTKTGGLTISGYSTTTGQALIGGVKPFVGSAAGDSLTVDANASNNAIAIQNSGATKAWQLDFTNTNDLDFTESGVANNRLTLKAGGNLGINIASPVSMLGVNGNGSFGAGFSAIAAPSNGLIVQGQTGISTSSPWAQLSVAGTSGGTIPLFTVSSSTTGFATSTAFQIDQNGNTFMGGTSTTTGNAYFANKIGVGVQAPAESIQVNAGELALTGQNSQATNPNGLDIFGGTNGGTVYARGDNSGGDDNLVLQGLTSIQFKTLPSGITTQQAVITNAGLFGIGTSSPFALLSVATPNGSTGSTLALFAIASSTATATTTQFVVLNTGNTGIGTSSPYATLGINAGAQATPYFEIGSSTGDVFKISPSANATVGIGTSTPTAAFVSVAASTTAGTVQTAYFGVIAIFAGLENGVTKIFEEIDQWGHLITSGDAPTVTGGTSSVSGNDRNGTITVTGTALTSVTLTFAHAYPSANVDCQASTNSTASTVDIASISATQVVFGLSVGLSSNFLYYSCAGHQ